MEIIGKENKTTEEYPFFYTTHTVEFNHKKDSYRCKIFKTKDYGFLHEFENRSFDSLKSAVEDVNQSYAFNAGALS